MTMKPSEIVIGKHYRIKAIDSYSVSRMCKIYTGRIVMCTSIGHGYIVSDLPNCSGVWYEELELDLGLTYETV